MKRFPTLRCKSLSLLGFIIVSFSLESEAANITYIGDSQSAVSYGLFGNLSQQINSRNNITSSAAVCGATVDDYSTSAKPGRCKYKGVTHLDGSKFKHGPGKTKLISELINDQTDAVIVQLGDNHLGQSEKAVSKRVLKIATQILSSHKSCIWIGPNRAPGKNCAKRDAQKKEAARIIQKTLANMNIDGKRCKFIDSYKLSMDKKIDVSRDCLHYKRSGYQAWSNAISGRVLKELNTLDAVRTESSNKSAKTVN